MLEPASLSEASPDAAQRHQCTKTAGRKSNLSYQFMGIAATIVICNCGLRLIMLSK